MSQITIQRGRKMYVHDFVDGTRYTVSDKPYRPRNVDFTTGAAKQLRDAGESSARAVTEVNQGERPLEPESAIANESAPPTTDNRPTSWRGVTPEKIGNKFYVKWHDPIVRQDYSVSGNTAQQCLENLFSNQHPIILRFIAMLPPEDEAQAQAATPAPTPNPPATPANGRVLRPGSQPDVRTIAMPERPTQSAQSMRQVGFQMWEQSASIEQIKARMKWDATFKQWYENQQAAVTPQKGF